MTQQHSASDDSTSPYGSAADLPSFQEMQEFLLGFKILTIFSREQRQKVREMKAELDRMVAIVDGFYDLLGERNWVFHELLSLAEVEAMVSAGLTPAEAESRLISMYQQENVGKWWLLRLQYREGLRERYHLIERAWQHYNDGQYDSCAILLVAVIDGFVNDFDPGERKGAHARSPDSMVAWDSIVGHHLGLTHVLKTFNKSFRKRVDDEIFEVHRHGIVHGMTPNFDNVVVATKAWNLLFAVVDWASATEKSRKPKEPKPTLKETWETFKEYAEHRRYREDFEPSVVNADEPGFDELGAVVVTRTFLEGWKNKRWAHVADCLGQKIMGSKSKGQQAVFAKDIYERHELVEYELQSVEFERASVAVVRFTGTVGDRSGQMSNRWLYHDGEERFLLPNDKEGGHWALAVYPPNRFWVEHDESSSQAD